MFVTYCSFHIYFYIYYYEYFFLPFTQFSYCHLFVSVGVLHMIFIQGRQNYQQLKYIQ
jgi:hypothetical protein